MLDLYVTSTKRQSGKTFVSAGLAATMQSLGYQTTVYKPIQTSGVDKNGFMQSPDLTYVKSIDPYINTHFTYLFKTDYEPLIVSELENKPIEIERILNEYKKISGSSDCTIIDGNGGVSSPISTNIYTIDLIKRLNIPVLIITEPNKNSINDTLLTLNSLAQKEIEVRGVVINNITSDCDKNILNSIPRIIEECSNAKILGLVSNLGNKIAPQDLISSILNGIDIESVFNITIEKLNYIQ